MTQTKLYKTDYSALKIKSYDLSGTVFDYRDRENLKISLLGEYQPRNASIVIDAIDLLNEIGLSVSEEALTMGLWKAAWPARFEVIGREPTVIFDGAHNPQGVRAAVNSIKCYYGSKRVVILTGVLSDKDYQSIVNTVCEVASSVYTLTPDNPRALDGSALAEIYRSRGIKATPCSSVEEALKMAVEEAEATQTALICLGSLYLYTEVFSAYKKAFTDK
jgi:dihydrofolate synthase/folylpolyglutamate synthase